MKPTDTRWEVNDDGDVICVYRGDPNRRTYAVRKEDFPLPAWKVAHLMNDAFASGIRAKTEQIRTELAL